MGATVHEFHHIVSKSFVRMKDTHYDLYGKSTIIDGMR
jgi:hypothetical protein